VLLAPEVVGQVARLAHVVCVRGGPLKEDCLECAAALGTALKEDDEQAGGVPNCDLARALLGGVAEGLASITARARDQGRHLRLRDPRYTTTAPELAAAPRAAAAAAAPGDAGSASASASAGANADADAEA